MYSTAGKCKPLRRKTKHKQASSTAGSYYIPTFLHSYIKKRVEVIINLKHK